MTVRRTKITKILNTAGRICILAFYLVMVIAPIYWMIISSLKTNKEIIQAGGAITYWPSAWTFEHYRSLFTHLDFGVFLRNSILLAVTTAVIVLTFSILGGYAMARYRFRIKTHILLFFLVTQMIPGILITIPIYVIYMQLGLINTLTGLLILYVTANTPFCLIVMRGFFERIPVALEEAARIDGCNRVTALRRVIIPVLFPGIVAVFVFAFIGAWNDLLTGVIFTNSKSMWTVPVGMRSLIGKYDVNWGQLMAGGTLALLPTTIMFAFVQRFIVEGLTSGAVKG
jgi:multiple sugar transport system permease protein